MREARSRFGPYRDSLPLPLWTSKRHGFGPPRPAPPRSACVVRELSGTNCTLSTGIRKLGDAWKSAPTTPSADVWHSPAPSSLVPGSKTPRPAPRSPLPASLLVPEGPAWRYCNRSHTISRECDRETSEILCAWYRLQDYRLVTSARCHPRPAQ